MNYRPIIVNAHTLGGMSSEFNNITPEASKSNATEFLTSSLPCLIIILKIKNAAFATRIGVL